MILFPFLLASLSAAAAQPAPAEADREPTIVVTGERIEDLREALRQCVARNCPADEDANASLAVAETEFLDGDYAAAARTIDRALDRHRGHARQFPEAVADLYRAEVRVSRHRGHDLQAVISTRRILRALQEGLPQEDYRHFVARLEIVQMLLQAGLFRQARGELDELARRAARAGRDDIRRMAEMRRLRVDYFLNRRETLMRLRALAASDDPAKRYEMISARLLLSAIYRMEGDTAQSDRLLSGLPTGAERRLLFAPRFLPRLLAHARSERVSRRVSAEFHNAWVDIAYWIGADGRVGDVEIVRQGADPTWAEPLLTAIRGRLYSASPTGEANYRLERHTFTAPQQIDNGTRVVVRNGARARVESMDLTLPREPGSAPAGGGRAEPN